MCSRTVVSWVFCKAHIFIYMYKYQNPNFVDNFSQSFDQKTMAPANASKKSIHKHIYLHIHIIYILHIYIYMCVHVYCKHELENRLALSSAFAALRPCWGTNWSKIGHVSIASQWLSTTDELLLLSCGQCARNCVEPWGKGKLRLSWGMFQFFFGAWASLRFFRKIYNG